MKDVLKGIGYALFGTLVLLGAVSTLGFLIGLLASTAYRSFFYLTPL